MPPVTNLTELWQDNEKIDALLLTAKPTTGADYAIFRALCEAFSFMPSHPIRNRAEAQLRVLFGCDLPPVPEHCDAIWRLTAERLLLSPLARTDAEAVSYGARRSLGLLRLPRTCDRFSDYPNLPTISARNYIAWEREQTRFLSEHPTCRGFSLFLTEGFLARNPSRYAADRHLAGEEPNPDLWTAQMFRFLAHALQKSDKKILLVTACEVSEIANLLALTAAKKGIPPILWMPRRHSDVEHLIDLCRAYPNPDVSFAVRSDDPVDPRDLATIVPIGRVHVFS